MLIRLINADFKIIVMNIRKLFFILLVGLFSTRSYAGSLNFNTAKLNIGWAQKSVDFDVYEDLESKPEGRLTSGYSYSLSLTAAAPYQYFGHSNFGYYYELGYSPIDVHEQTVDSGSLDLGTHVKGEYFYITPILYYNFGSRSPRSNFSTKLGLGYGVGHIRAKGDIVYTRNNQNVSHPVKLNDWGDSVSILLDVRNEYLFFRAIVNGPIVTTNKVSYSVSDTSVEFGFSYYIK